WSGLAEPDRPQSLLPRNLICPGQPQKPFLILPTDTFLKSLHRVMHSVFQMPGRHSLPARLAMMEKTHAFTRSGEWHNERNWGWIRWKNPAGRKTQSRKMKSISHSVARKHGQK